MEIKDLWNLNQSLQSTASLSFPFFLPSPLTSFLFVEEVIKFKRILFEFQLYPAKKVN